MSKIPSTKGNPSVSSEMLSEYRFDYRKARRNRFAQSIEEGSLIVVLDPDIAKVFQTPEAVKQVLRALIQTMPRAV